MDQHSHSTSKHTHMIAVPLCVCVLEPCTLNPVPTPQHDVRVIEARTVEGYGVRWKHDGSEFRGFLEPQMADGHTVGWRH